MKDTAKDLERLVKICEELKLLDMKSDWPVSDEIIKMVDDWILDLHTPQPPSPAADKVRDAAEIQKAHDVLCLIAEGKINIDLPAHILALTHATADCLCWVLEHTHGGMHFEKNLASLMAMAKAKGYVLAKLP